MFQSWKYEADPIGNGVLGFLRSSSSFLVTRAPLARTVFRTGLRKFSAAVEGDATSTRIMLENLSVVLNKRFETIQAMSLLMPAKSSTMYPVNHQVACIFESCRNKHLHATAVR